MPEGPSIVILKELVQQFVGKTILAVEGNSKIDIHRLNYLKVISFKSWGKHFLICFSNFTLKVHFLMFGTYRINEKKDNATPRLSLEFENGEINLYSCSIKFLEGDINLHYDWAADVMNEQWNPKKAKQKLKEIRDNMICDALLEQEIFSGVGNIIKNEVLYRMRIHPESIVENIPLRKLNQTIKECSLYSFEFLEWKRNYVLRDHWLVHTKKICQNCQIPLQLKYTGNKKRRSFFCSNCQILYK